MRGVRWMALVALALLGPSSIALAAAAGAVGTAPRRSGGTVGVAHRVLVSPSRCARNRAAGPITFVSPFAYDASAGIIDVVDAKALGYFADLCLDVHIVVPAPSLSPFEIVASGRGTITGEGSAADSLLARSGGADVVSVATFADTSDYALLTRPGIHRLSQLDGKLLGYHVMLPVVLSEMLQRAGARLSSIHQVNDTSYDPTLLFASRPGYSALQAYRSNEPLTLQAAGYQPGKQFQVWTPGQFKVKGTFNTQLVNGAFLRAHSGAVADFMRAELHALDWCLVQQDRCVALEHEAAQAAGFAEPLSHLAAEWRVEVGLMEHHHLKGEGIGVETIAEWRPEATALVRYGLLRKLPDLSRAENTTLVASLYRDGTLVWPGR